FAYVVTEDTPEILSFDLPLLAAAGVSHSVSVYKEPLTGGVVPEGVTAGTLAVSAVTELTSRDWLYTPATDYVGYDEFYVVIKVGAVQSAPTLVTLTVTPVDDAPKGVSDITTTTEDEEVAIEVLANDREVDGQSMILAELQPGA